MFYSTFLRARNPLSLNLQTDRSVLIRTMAATIGRTA